MDSKKKGTELHDLDVERVDGVDRPATGRTFLLFKNEDGSPRVFDQPSAPRFPGAASITHEPQAQPQIFNTNRDAHGQVMKITADQARVLLKFGWPCAVDTEALPSAVAKSIDGGNGNVEEIVKSAPDAPWYAVFQYDLGGRQWSLPNFLSSVAYDPEDSGFSAPSPADRQHEQDLGLDGRVVASAVHSDPFLSGRPRYRIMVPGDAQVEKSAPKRHLDASFGDVVFGD